ncbi:MAG: hypothetical protein ACOCRK_01445 [bacterium]
MNRLILIINNKRVYIYEMHNKSIKLFRINGEEYIDLNINESIAMDGIRNYLLKTFNYEDFTFLNLQVIYNNIDIHIIKDILEFFMPCNKLQVFNLIDIMPLLLLKTKRIIPGEEKIVSYKNNKWLIKLTKEGQFTIDHTDKKANIQLETKMIPLALLNNYSFPVDETRLNYLNEKIEDYEMSLNYYIKENRKQYKQISKLKDIIHNKNMVTHGYLESIRKLEERNGKLIKQIKQLQEEIELQEEEKDSSHRAWFHFQKKF